MKNWNERDSTKDLQEELVDAFTYSQQIRNEMHMLKVMLAHLIFDKKESYNVASWMPKSLIIELCGYIDEELPCIPELTKINSK